MTGSPDCCCAVQEFLHLFAEPVPSRMLRYQALLNDFAAVATAHAERIIDGMYALLVIASCCADLQLASEQRSVVSLTAHEDSDSLLSLSRPVMSQPKTASTAPLWLCHSVALQIVASPSALAGLPYHLRWHAYRPLPVPAALARCHTELRTLEALMGALLLTDSTSASSRQKPPSKLVLPLMCLVEARGFVLVC
jgi:hypothetical protein